MAALATAQRLGGGAEYYALQAAITACHMRARTGDETDWERIVLLYDALMQVAPSSIVALNRAVAVGMAHGPAAGLAAVEAIAADGDDAGMARHHLFHSVRGDLLAKLGNFSAAREATERAIDLTRNRREQELLTERLRKIEDRIHGCTGLGRSGP
jgi:predicted RNA polymerase sigma factor